MPQRSMRSRSIALRPSVPSMLCALLLAGTLVFTPQALSAESEQESASMKGLMGDQQDTDSPLYVKSDSLQLNAKNRVFTYSGNVEILRADVRITCDTMEGTYGEDSKLKTILCQDNVVITRGKDMRASANRAHYDVPDSIIELTEGPQLARDGNVLSADKITIFVDEDRSEAEGNVRVKVIKAEQSDDALPVAAADTDTELDLEQE